MSQTKAESSHEEAKPRWKPEPGVYLGLSDEAYHSADAIGSSDMRTLLRDPASWWYGSAHNKHRYSTASTESGLKAGKALHTLILEGEGAYQRRFAFSPGDKGTSNLAETRDEIREVLKRHGITPMTYDIGKLIAQARGAGLGGYLYQTAKLDYDRAVSLGRGKITPHEDIAYRHMAEILRDHPDIGPILAEGLSEVSVFWYDPDDEDTLLRARFDKLTVGLSVDLKSLAGREGRSPADAAAGHIADYEYDIQRRLYHDARLQFRRLVEMGEVFRCHHDEDGAEARIIRYEPPKDDPVEPIAASEEWSWVWIFYQVRCDQAGKKARAPVVLPWVHKPSGDVWAAAQQKIKQALENYRTYRDRYGFDTPWFEIKEVQYVDDEDLRRLLFKGVPS